MKRFLLLMLLTTSCQAASWECVSRMVTCHTWRMSVPNGWIVASDNSAGGGEHGYAMTFVPDQTHAWSS